MISAISGYTPYATYGAYGASYASRAARTQGAEKSQAAQPSLVTTARKAAQPETPVQPVTPARSISGQEDPAQSGLLRFGSDPAEMAVRMRIQYPGGSAQQEQPANAEEAVLPGVKGDDAQQARTPVPDSANASGAQGKDAILPGARQAQNDIPGLKAGGDDKDAANPALDEAKSAQEVMEEAECQTCKDRKYQDGSDDPGVSFKTPTNIAPEQAASAVRGHENEHVVREQAKARQEDRKVVSQSVTYHTDICPECGKVYVSGGTTRTVTKADTDQQAQQQNQQNQNQQNPLAPFSVVA